MRRPLPALLAVAIVACVLAPSAHALPAREIAGVALHPWSMKDAAEVERTFADLAGLGVRWARVDLRWHLFEPSGPAVTAGRGNWTEMDRIAAAAGRHGIKLLPIVAFSPPAPAARCGPCRTPSPSKSSSPLCCGATRRYRPGSSGTSPTG